ncbi:SRPBCC family protein [Streptomyces sp. ISL-11]|uniref:SRPBCC family protein n=1 Tax=Streptomyces sp. ISL-11 TaxID=2819174 RepID=UPI001BE9AFA6|nr:SRPBCC family protein [Streptomyces sp. ISL-11]MBT2386501.1 SRPBCC family protein [Streptomyces sp. ISL-11]
MSEYESSRTMPALPEHVFDQAREVRRLDSWMPAELHVRAEDLPAVTVHEDTSGQDAPALFRAQPEQLRLEWGTRESGSYAGWLQVAGIGSGASEVTVHLSFFDEGHDPGAETVRSALENSLERLEEQVRLRVDDGG